MCLTYCVFGNDTMHYNVLQLQIPLINYGASLLLYISMLSYLPQHTNDA